MSTILVVDDDALFRTIIRHHLIGIGYDVIEHDSGIGVDKIILKYRPVACIVDIIMDEKDGADLIREIAQWPLRPKLIALSSDYECLALANNFGADAVLSKPIVDGIIEQTLDRLGIHTLS